MFGNGDIELYVMEFGCVTFSGYVGKGKVRWRDVGLRSKAIGLIPSRFVAPA
jgi:hypothetical protein